MTEAVTTLSSSSLCCNRVCETRMKNEDQIHTVAGIPYGLFGEPLRKPAGKLLPQTANLAATSGHASNDKCSADINSLDNLCIKSLRPSIIRGRLNDT
jgi:hypothetical protein